MEQRSKKIKPVDHADLMELFNAAPRKVGGTTVRSRRKMERPATVKPTDGRRLRSKGRDRQYNTNVTPDLNDRAMDMMERFALTKADFTEYAILAAIAILRSSGVEGLKQAGGIEPDA